MLPASLYGQLAGGAVAADPIMQAAAAAALASSATQGGEVVGSGSRDTTYTKIFVGGLPYHTSDKTLHEYFEQFGDIEEAVVITDRQTQKSRGYGFVTMKDRPAAERACKDPNPIIDGRKANVNLAYLGAKPRGNIQLAALSTGLQTLPLQTQLQALFPARIGEAPTVDETTRTSQKMTRKDDLMMAVQERALLRMSPYTLPIRHLPQMYYPQTAALMNPALLGQQQQAAAAQQQSFLDYNTALAALAANGQNAAALGIQSSQAGLEQYGYPYGMVSAGYPLQTQLAAVPKIDH